MKNYLNGTAEIFGGNRAYPWLTSTMVFALFLFLFGFVAYGANSPRYTGLFLGLVAFVAAIFAGFGDIRGELVRVYRCERVLWWLFVLVALVMVVSTALHSLYGFQDMYQDLAPIFAMGVLMVCLPMARKNLLVRYLLILMVIAFANDLVMYAWKTYIHYNIYQRFDRNFNQYSVLLFPFMMGYLLWGGANRYFRVGLVLVLGVPGLVALLWTGERGSWGAVFVEAAIMLALSGDVRRFLNKKMLLMTAAGVAGLLMAGVFFYQTNQIFKGQINKGLGSSGRSVIIATRFPVFMKYGDKVLGFGYSSEAYNVFFSEHGAPKVYGVKIGDSFHYFQDGPFLIQLFYHFGSVGLLSYLALMGYLLFRLYIAQRRCSRQYEKLYYISILASFVGYFLVGGLFEGRWISFMFLLLFLYVLAATVRPKSQEASGAAGVVTAT